METFIHKNPTSVFSVFFVCNSGIGKDENHFKYASSGEWVVNELCFSYVTASYLAVKMNKLLMDSTWMILKCITLHEKGQTKRLHQLDFTCIISFWKGQNHEDRKISVVCKSVGGRNNFKEARGNLSRWQNFMYRLQYQLVTWIYAFADFIECTLSGVIEIEIFFLSFFIF